MEHYADITEKLQLWKNRLAKSLQAWAPQQEKMERCRSLYQGSRRLSPVTDAEVSSGSKTARHVHNIIAENIESMVDNSIPQPKVTAVRPEDRELAELVEDMLRNEVSRIPFQELNDMTERMVPLNGGALYLVEWDAASGTHTSSGELSVSVIHPRQLAPQEGVFTSVEDMDYVILCIPQTRQALSRRYAAFAGTEGGELVTRNVAYYKNSSGGIGLFSWAEDTVLEDMPEYQARTQVCCAACHTPMDGHEKCPKCGGTRCTLLPAEVEVMPAKYVTALGKSIPAGAKIPFYKPDRYPLVLQKNVSVYGQLLGDSDAEKIADLQNTLNRMDMKIIDRIVKAGTRITLPDRADFRIDPEDAETWYVGSAADKAMIGVYDFKGDLTDELTYRQSIYQQARYVLGITDSYQGRDDKTAISGVAKQLAASQSAGRLESKRIMKQAAYARLFELMFRFRLAYADEPRPVKCRDSSGNAVYKTFDRYDFLQLDEAGQYWWNDMFIFGCDTSETFTGNRETMWQETEKQLHAGAFGPVDSTETLILYWAKMEQLRYPGAYDTKKALEQRLKEERESTNERN